MMASMTTLKQRSISIADAHRLSRFFDVNGKAESLVADHATRLYPPLALREDFGSVSVL